MIYTPSKYIFSVLLPTGIQTRQSHQENIPVHIWFKECHFYQLIFVLFFLISSKHRLCALIRPDEAVLMCAHKLCFSAKIRERMYTLQNPTFLCIVVFQDAHSGQHPGWSQRRYWILMKCSQNRLQRLRLPYLHKALTGFEYAPRSGLAQASKEEQSTAVFTLLYSEWPNLIGELPIQSALELICLLHG